MNFREFINYLEGCGLKRITKQVDPVYEIPTIMKRMEDTPLLFENVKGSSFPVAANLCSTRAAVAAGLMMKDSEIITKVAAAIDSPVKNTIKEMSGYNEIESDLSKLPILTYYPNDGGPYIASSVNIISSPEIGTNTSYHRVMITGKDTVTMRILPRHFNTFLEKGVKEFAICIGNPVSVMVAGAISVEIGKNELEIANALTPTPLIDVCGHKVPESEIIMIAKNTGELHSEGPFLDLTETPDIIREQPAFKIERIFVKENAVFHGLLPGGLEHKTLMGMPKEPTIFREINKVCKCLDVSITPGGCSWLHANIKIKKQNPDDGIKALEAAFKGHASLKHAFVVDEDIDIHSPMEMEWAMATRFQGHTGLFVKTNEKGSSLDPSADPLTRETTKTGFDLTIPAGKNPEDFKKLKLPMDLNVCDYL